MGDLVSAAMIYAYPAAFAALLAASLFVHKIHVIIFGGGAQAASNLHRQEQFRMALPAFLKNPIGYGAGQSGRAMGYGSGDFIAIDSYWISLTLDYGLVGLLAYIGMFATTITAATRALLRQASEGNRDAGMLIPLVSCLSAFLMIRGVFAQPEIHPFIFTILGMTVALVYRSQRALAQSPATPST